MLQSTRHERSRFVCVALAAIVVLLLCACGGTTTASRCVVSGKQLSELNAAYESALGEKPKRVLNEDDVNAIIENNLALCVLGLKGYDTPAAIPQSNWVLMYMSSQAGQARLAQAKKDGGIWKLPMDEVTACAKMFYADAEISPETIAAEKLTALSYDPLSSCFFYPTGNSAYISDFAGWAVYLGRIEANGKFIAFNIELAKAHKTAFYTIVVRAYENGLQFEACYPAYDDTDPIIRSPERVMTTYHCPAANCSPKKAAETLCTKLLEECKTTAANRDFTIEKYSNLRCELSAQSDSLWTVEAFADGIEPIQGRFLALQGDCYFYFYDPSGKGKNPVDYLTIKDGKLTYMPALQQAVTAYFTKRQENFDYTSAGVPKEQGRSVTITPRINAIKNLSSSDNGNILYALEVSEWNWLEYGNADTMGYENLHRMTIQRDSSGNYAILTDAIKEQGGSG